MMILKKVGVMSVANIQGLIGVFLGLILGIIYAITGAATGGALGPMFSWIMIIIMPIAYGIFGFLGGIVGAWLYNVVAGWIGGVNMDLVKK